VADLEDTLDVRIVPVVQHRLQQVGVTSGWYRIEKAAAHQFAASCKSSLFDKAAGVRDDVREVEKHSPHAGMPG
jgi:hypothetical protein